MDEFDRMGGNDQVGGFDRMPGFDRSAGSDRMPGFADGEIRRQPVPRRREMATGRQEKRVRNTRRKILKAAREIFAEWGVDLTTIDDITVRADIGKGTFYYHFADKNEVVAELIEHMLDELVTLIKERCEGIEGLRELLNAMIGAHIEYFANRWEDFVLYYQGRADLKLKENYSGVELPFLRYLEAIETILASAMRQNVPKASLRRIGCAVAGFLSGYYSFSVIASEDEDVDASLASLKGALVSSLARFISEAIQPELPLPQVVDTHSGNLPLDDTEENKKKAG